MSVKSGEDSTTWSWTDVLATNKALSMKGELTGGEGKYSYTEQLTANGRLDWVAVWSCVERAATTKQAKAASRQIATW